MQDIVSLLEKQSALSKSDGFKVRKVERDNCAVIVEPREHEMLEPVIRNVMTHLTGDHGNFSTYSLSI